MRQLSAKQTKLRAEWVAISSEVVCIQAACKTLGFDQFDTW